MEIETKNASLDTLAVTIRALHVSGKQMTLAVFKQLPEMSAFSETGEFGDFEPWGTVRYGIKDSFSRWLVASKSGMLYRCGLDFYEKLITYAERSLEASKDNLLLVKKWAIEYYEYKKRSTNNGVIYPNKPYCARHLNEPNDNAIHEFEIYVKLREKELSYEKNRMAVMVAIDKLPQLFIAV